MNKNIYHKQFYVLLLRLGTVIIFFSISRLLFLIINHKYLIQPDISQSFHYWIKLFIGGIRFDLYSITIINATYIFFTLIPFNFRYNKIYEKTTRIIFFYIPNIIAFAADYIDIIYSRYTNKRMTADVFNFLKSGGGFINLIPKFIHDFWYMFIIFILMVVIFIIINNKIKVKKPKHNTNFLSFFISNFLLLIIMSALCVILSRGGLQPRPININTAAYYSNPNHYILVLNSSFTIIRTFHYQSLIEYNYYNEETLNKIYKPLFIPKDNIDYKTSINKDNIIILILESFSAEYSHILNNDLVKSFTPTLDSLGKEGRIILGYSNGTRSIEGIPAIISSIPTLMNSEYIASNYSGNKITSLPYLLHKLGYKSAFMHGGDNGTMYFDIYSKIADYDYYYGRTEYNNDLDYDGYWGITDDKFLEYCIKQLDTITKPFFTSIFTLSSHHPFKLPEYYKKDNNIDKECIEESIKYTDWSLNKFFKIASQSEWFKNTIFILTADHPYQSSENPKHNHRLGNYEIPIVIYKPNDTLPIIIKPFAQQIDIMPTILDYINYPDTVFVFGKSIFDNKFNQSYAINYRNNTYQFISNEYVIIFDGENVTTIYARKEDIYQANNLINTIILPQSDIEMMKAFIQTYNHSLIYNNMFY